MKIKAQTSLMVIVSLITMFLIIWASSSFTNLSTGKRLTEQIKQQLVYKETDYMKGFSRVALIFSSHNALRDTGKLGGVLGIPQERNWICTDPKIPPVDQVRYHLSKDTIDYLNRYIVNLNVANQRDILRYGVSKYACVDYDVSQSSVDSGLNDISYNIGSYGSNIEVIGEDGNAKSDNDVYEEVSPVRYWLMYRQYSEWANRNVLKHEVATCLEKICDCPSIDHCPTFQTCVEHATQVAVKDLQRGFDDGGFPTSSRITCSGGFACNYTETEECAGSDEVQTWENPPFCNRCELGTTGPLCGGGIKLDSNGNRKSVIGSVSEEKLQEAFSWTPPKGQRTNEDFCNGKVCKFWKETRGAMEATFTCIDKKHLLSTKDHDELEFSVYATIDVKKKNCPENSAIMDINDCVWTPIKWKTVCNIDPITGIRECEDVPILWECTDCNCKDQSGVPMPTPNTGSRWCVKELGVPIPKPTTTTTSTTIPKCPNMLTNPSFGGSYAQTGTSINMPGDWTLTCGQTPSCSDNENIETIDPGTGNNLDTIEYLPPEANTLAKGTVDDQFYVDNDRNLKIFKWGPTQFTMCQDVSGLTPGQYDFTINVYPDLYDVQNENKIYATDPASGRIRIFTNDGYDSGSMDGNQIKYGQYNEISRTITAKSSTNKICIEVVSPFPYRNNWWFDAFSLRQEGMSC